MEQMKFYKSLFESRRRNWKKLPVSLLRIYFTEMKSRKKGAWSIFILSLNVENAALSFTDDDFKFGKPGFFRVLAKNKTL